MRLSDIVGHLDLATYPIVAMVIFLAVFAGVCLRVFSKGRGEEFARAASMPLDESPATGTDLPANTGGQR
jgi:cbb3-type cytochrome oxidase subunit 3